MTRKSVRNFDRPRVRLHPVTFWILYDTNEQDNPGISFSISNSTEYYYTYTCNLMFLVIFELGESAMKASQHVDNLLSIFDGLIDR